MAIFYETGNSFDLSGCRAFHGESLSEFVQKDPVAGGALVLPKRPTVAGRTLITCCPANDGDVKCFRQPKSGRFFRT